MCPGQSSRTFPYYCMSVCVCLFVCLFVGLCAKVYRVRYGVCVFVIVRGLHMCVACTALWCVGVIHCDERSMVCVCVCVCMYSGAHCELATASLANGKNIH